MGLTPVHTAELHVHEPPPRPSQFAPNIDTRLEEVILRALSKRPIDCHPTARHLGAALRKLMPELPDVVAAIAPGSTAASQRSAAKPVAVPAVPKVPPVAPVARLPPAPRIDAPRPAPGTPTTLVVKAKASEPLRGSVSSPTGIDEPEVLLDADGPEPFEGTTLPFDGGFVAVPVPPAVPGAGPRFSAPAIPFPTGTTVPIVPREVVAALRESKPGPQPVERMPPALSLYASPSPLRFSAPAAEPLAAISEVASHNPVVTDWKPWEAAPAASRVRITGLGAFVIGLLAGALGMSVVLLARSLFATR